MHALANTALSEGHIHMHTCMYYTQAYQGRAEANAGQNTDTIGLVSDERVVVGGGAASALARSWRWRWRWRWQVVRCVRMLGNYPRIGTRCRRA